LPSIEIKTSMPAVVEKPLKSRSKRATSVPNDFEITDDMRIWASQAGFTNIGDLLVAETEKFLDYYRSRGQLMKDWVAAWRNWIRRAAETSSYGSAARVSRASPKNPIDAAFEDAFRDKQAAVSGVRLVEVKGVLSV
jgi:hypothetical protein